MTYTLNQTHTNETGVPPALLGASQAMGIPGGSMVCLREGIDGARTLCLTPLRNDERLGDCIPAGPALEAAVAPLVARFAALVFTEHDAMVEPLLQQLRWIAYEQGIDHVVLPLWPETRLAQRLTAIAIDLGMPANFILTQDEASWPGAADHLEPCEFSDLSDGLLYA